MLDFCIELFLSIFLLFVGYSFTILFVKKFGILSLLTKFFISLVSGIALIIVPTILWVLICDSNLMTFFTVLNLTLSGIGIFLFFRNFSVVKEDFMQLYSFTKRMLNGNLLERFAFVSIIILFLKTSYLLSIVSINVDALYFYLPSALHFVNLGQVFPYADPPVAPLLYSWSYSTIGNLSIEPFRQIPILFIISVPLLVYAFSHKFLTNNQSLIALILCVFSPFLDTATYLWPWHTDFVAAIFVGLVIFFMFETFKYREALVGLCLSLSLLTKTPFGLAASILVLTLLLHGSKNIVSNRKILVLVRFFFPLMILTLLMFGLEYSFSLVSFMYPIIPALLLTGFFIVILFYTFATVKITFSFNFWIFFLFLLPVILWVLRQVLLGGTPFALPLFEVQANNGDWFSSFKSQITNISYAPLPFTSIFLIFYHPLLGLGILPILILGILFVFKLEKTKILLLLSFLYYFIWVIAFSRGASFRHLLPILFFLYPIVALGISKLFGLITDISSKTKFLTLFLLVTLLSTQNMTVYQAYQRLSEGFLKMIFSVVITGYPWLFYEDPSQMMSFLPLLLFSLIILFLCPILIETVSKRMKFNLQFICFKKIILILFILSSCLIMIFPTFYDSIITTDGDIDSYPIARSWYREQIEISDTLKELIVNGSVLTFGFDAFYYLAANNISYYDLWHGHIASFPLSNLSIYDDFRMAIEAKSIEPIASALSNLNVRYVLLPLPGAFAYNDYQKFTEVCPIFDILIERGPLKLIQTFPDACFELYHLNFDETMYTEIVLSDSFENSDHTWIGVQGSWIVTDGQYCGNYSGFGVSVVESETLTNIIVEVDVMGKNNVQDTGLVFRYVDPQNYYRLFISGSSKQLRLLKMVNGTANYPETWVKWISTEPNVWYNLKIVIMDNTFMIYLNDEYQYSVVDENPILSGMIGVGGYDEESCFDNLQVERIFLQNPLT